MTKKRYHKLFQAYMARVMTHEKGAGWVLRAANKSNPMQQGVHHSYQEAWTALSAYAAEYGIGKKEGRAT